MLEHDEGIIMHIKDDLHEVEGKKIDSIGWSVIIKLPSLLVQEGGGGKCKNRRRSFTSSLVGGGGATTNHEKRRGFSAHPSLVAANPICPQSRWDYSLLFPSVSLDAPLGVARVLVNLLFLK